VYPNHLDYMGIAWGRRQNSTYIIRAAAMDASQGTGRPIEGVDRRQSTDPRGVDEGGAPTGPVLRAVGPSVGRNLHSAMRPQMRLQAESRLAPRAID
jgi:hypothetical protein